VRENTVRGSLFQGVVLSPTMPLDIAPLSLTGRSRSRRHSHQTRTHLYASIISCCILFSCAAALSPPWSSRARNLSFQNHAETSVSARHGQLVLAAPGHPTRLYNLLPKDDFDKDDFLDDEDDFDEKYDPSVAAQIRKAKKLLNDAKKKQKSQEEAVAKAAVKAEAAADWGELENEVGGGEEVRLPFFASKSFTASVVENSRKIKSKTKSGEIIADGDTMASLSKSEPWERRSLQQMFKKEARTDFDGNLVDNEVDGRALADRDVASSIYNLRKSLQTDDFRRVFDSRNRFIGEVD